jgi:hypothetical protein
MNSRRLVAARLSESSDDVRGCVLIARFVGVCLFAASSLPAASI